ncbi:beta-L-arabinofuranosidase domain-containing protein, partial [Kitasatospora herbaricolor]|uniref:beta-L-arabinofuranosidase domain-containing protein n=1 Tax=Kitasatospora herbaricolor TaxID=68217 RepID=UPI0036D8D5DC
MPLNRRQFVNGTVAVGASALALHGADLASAAPAPPAGPGSPAAAGPAAVAPARGGLYTPNAAPLQPTAFLRLPPGSITARGWLDGQLRLQLAGLCGRYEEISHFLDMNSSGWVRPDRAGWEELPYWLRGYVDLAVATGDATALTTTRRWIDAIVATRQPDGFFGPAALRTSLNGGLDAWPFLPLTWALRSWQEYSGDTRIIPLLSGFFRYLDAQGPGAFNSSWVSQRWGDALDSVFWLFNRTGESFLLGLADRMHSGGANWVDNLPSPHNVNIAQGYREPAQYALRSGSAAHTAAAYHNYDAVMAGYGQFPGGGFAGDENVRAGFGDPRQGFETCGIVEFMASHQLMNRLTGDPVWADRCEDLAFNSLPASLDPSGRAVHYITSANSVDLDDAAKTQGQFQNGFAMQAYQAGVDQYRCCPHNYGMGWPYFLEELWLATPDHGLAAAMYAASTVTAKVGDGTTVTFTETTDYPFTETVTLRLSTPRAVAFPLYLRVPGWCQAPVLTVNGAPVAAPAGPAYTVVTRTWKDGDTVTLRLPQRTTVRTWGANHGAVSVDHGPLTYALRIGEQFTQYGGSAVFPSYAVHATSPWNYGLALDAGAPVLAATGGPLAANPFTQAGSPLRITVPARRIAEWQADSQHVVAPLQDGPARSTAAVETVTLIPMGAARLRITAFPTTSPTGRPWTPPAPWVRIRNQNSGKVLGVDVMSTADSARVVQFADNGTADHLWQLVDNGGGWYRIRNQNSGKVLGVDRMSTADSAQVVQFADNGTADHLWQLVDNG